MPLWTAQEMAEAMNAEMTNCQNIEIDDISIDSRTLTKGAAYFAIQGVSQDGHLYVDNAFEHGAHIAVIAKEKIEEFAGKNHPLLIVDDVLFALEQLGRAARERCSGKIIAITGSAGKTSTKEMMRAVYANIGKTHASLASLNNHWGVPLTLARMPRDTEFGIFEIGMNHKNEITPLVAMVRPHIACVTTVGAAHAGHFTSVEEIAEAKAEIFSGLEDEGIALLPIENDYYSILQQYAGQDAHKCLSFGAQKGDITFTKEEIDGGRAHLSFSYKQANYPINLKTSGQHMFSNAACVFASLVASGNISEKGLKGFGNFDPGQGRGALDIITLSPEVKITLLDESYNANPISMAATLLSLSEIKKDEEARHVAILGDMLELGEQSQSYHEQLAEQILDLKINPVFLVGPEMQALYEKLKPHKDVHWTQLSGDIIPHILKKLHNNDCVLVKGSLGIRMKTVIDALKENQ